MLDRNSATWVSLKRDIILRIEKLRDDLEQSGMDHSASQGLRGSIAGLRWIIAHVEPDPPTLSPLGTDYMQAHDPS